MLSTGSLINDFDFSEAAGRFRSAAPFPHICFDNFLKPEFAEKVEAAFPSFEEAQRLGKGFQAVNERGKYQVTDATLFPEPVKLLYEELQSPHFIQQMRTLSGFSDLVADPELVGAGMHQTGPRGHLDVHIDFNYIKHRKLHRRLNILVFFNKNWQDSWGGKTELWDRRVRKLTHSFSPVFNRCVIFETSEVSWHGVSAVTCPAGRSRKSYAGYYYSPCSEDDIKRDAHSTIFRARPNEYRKKYLSMPLEAFKRSAIKTLRAIRHLR